MNGTGDNWALHRLPSVGVCVAAEKPASTEGVKLNQSSGLRSPAWCDTVTDKGMAWHCQHFRNTTKTEPDFGMDGGT